MACLLSASCCEVERATGCRSGAWMRRNAASKSALLPSCRSSRRLSRHRDLVDDALQREVARWRDRHADHPAKQVELETGGVVGDVFIPRVIRRGLECAG